MLKIYIITNFHMRYYFDINTCIVTTVSGISDTLTRRATLPLQLVYIYMIKFYVSSWLKAYNDVKNYDKEY